MSTTRTWNKKAQGIWQHSQYGVVMSVKGAFESYYQPEELGYKEFDSLAQAQNYLEEVFIDYTYGLSLNTYTGKKSWKALNDKMTSMWGSIIRENGLWVTQDNISYKRLQDAKRSMGVSKLFNKHLQHIKNKPWTIEAEVSVKEGVGVVVHENSKYTTYTLVARLIKDATLDEAQYEAMHYYFTLHDGLFLNASGWVLEHDGSFSHKIHGYITPSKTSLGMWESYKKGKFVAAFDSIKNAALHLEKPRFKWMDIFSLSLI